MDDAANSIILNCAELVIESLEDKVRQHCAALSPAARMRLSTRKFIGNFSSNKDFNKIYHDSDPQDIGYIQLRDENCGRTIFVTDKFSGMTESFHLDKQITCFFNVIEPVNLHVSFVHMKACEQTWQLDNLMSVALQIHDTEGNVALFCNHGRSRSPMYLVVYLVIFYDLSVDEA